MPFEYLPIFDAEAHPQGVIPFPDNSHYARLDSDAQPPLNASYSYWEDLLEQSYWDHHEKSPQGTAMSSSSRNVSPDARSSASVEHWAVDSVGSAEGNVAIHWDWDIEQEDRKREARADVNFARNAQLEQVPFQVDRRLLKDIVKEKMEQDVGRINFISSGTFHKAYLVTLVDGREVIARVARRFMPRVKTESEVATMHYLRKYTSIPVPDVYHYDANPYNRLGGEFIIMSKAKGIPLSRVYHSMGHEELLNLLENTAKLLIPLFGHRFDKLGSLQFGRSPPARTATSTQSNFTPSIATPHAQVSMSEVATPTLAHPVPRFLLPRFQTPADVSVGPIVSWPFFGSGRGELAHPDEIDRGPWASTAAYLRSCAARELAGVVRENEGKAVPHRLHLDPDEIQSSRHRHHLDAVPDDESEASTEWDWEESEQEWEGPGDTMYRDYRRMQRGTFLLAHMVQREEKVRQEMDRFIRIMERLGVRTAESGEWMQTPEQFALDCHDLSLENVFVDEHDHSKITCIIDWESTTTRPLWASAHLPPFLQSSPFTAKLFRYAVAKIAHGHTFDPKAPVHFKDEPDLADTAAEWLHYEATGAKLRSAHRFVEWDGWEEGLVDSIFGPEDQEEDWFKPWADEDGADSVPLGLLSPDAVVDGDEPDVAPGKKAAGKVLGRPSFATSEEREQEKLLNATGDICGGRGGELGRRLDHWLREASLEDKDGPLKKWEGVEDDSVAAHA